MSPQVYGTPSPSVTHSREDALDAREFELLFEGAQGLDGDKSLQASAAVLLLGRLGLRRGEMAHMQSDWLDKRNQMIEVPYHQECHGSRINDEPCGDCCQLAEQRAEHTDVTVEEAIEQQWQAKTPAAAREVYYGFSSRCQVYIERLLDHYGSWPLSPQGVYRRVSSAAANAQELSEDDVFPHALRATAATYHAGRGLELSSLLQMMGWARPSTAERYLARSSQNTARQLDSIHS